MGRSSGRGHRCRCGQRARYGAGRSLRSPWIQKGPKVCGPTRRARGGVTLTWQGEARQELRATFSLRDSQPVVEELSARNLLRQEAVARTEAKDVAFIYKAGLKGFAVNDATKVVWRDTSQVWQEQDFGGEVNQEPVNVQARNRLEVLQAGAGSLAVFPPPHKFFFARENEVNLGYVFYRKDTPGTFSLGVMQPERGAGYWPWGVAAEVWQHRESTSRHQELNYALYNAPPGTVQRMAVFYYLSPSGSRETQAAVMAYTRDDVYRPLPGFKTVTGHFHLELNEAIRDRGTSDFQPTWVHPRRDGWRRCSFRRERPCLRAGLSSEE